DGLKENANMILVKLDKKREKQVIIEENPNSNFYFNIIDWIDDVMKVDEKVILEKGKIAILWDSSFSRNETDKSKDLLFIKEFLKTQQKLDVDVISFSNEIHDTISFTITKEEGVQQLLDFLSRIVYDGATNLSNSLLKILKSTTYDLVLLFSDGFDNMVNQLVKLPKY